MSFQIDFPAQPRFPIISPNLTVTASAPILQLSQTWNNAGVTFVGATLNIVPTASASASKYFEVQRNGIPMLDLQSGSSGNTSLVMRQPDGTIRFSISSAAGNSSLQLLNSSGSGVTMTDEGAHVLALRNSTNAQTFRVYNTYTDGSNYERGVIDWASAANVLKIGAQALGTGTLRGVQLVGQTLSFRTTDTDRWTINSSGHLLAVADNTYDIGASGATRPRNLYVGTAIYVPSITTTSHINAGGYVLAGATYIVGWSGRSFLDSPSDGVIRLTNNAQTDFTRLQFGGTTSSFPALSRSGAGIVCQLADGSARAVFECAAFGSNSTITASGAITGLNGTAIPAGGAAGTGYKFSSTTNFGVFFGSGAPSLSAAKGSLYLRSDGSGTGDRMYVNTDGSTTWTAVTTAT